VIVGLVLAAGLARRMGAAKLLLPVRGQPLVRWSVEALRPHVDALVVVVPPEDAALRQALADVDATFVTNPRPEDGQGTSIAAGVNGLPAGTEAVVVVLGDQPRLPDGLLADLLARFRASGRPIAAPVYRGVQGTPVVFARAVFDELRALGGDEGARAVVRRDPDRVTRLAVDADMPLDVDTPEDYARLV
jgi:molybdenum cofactor cytidylyltransferase